MARNSVFDGIYWKFSAIVMGAMPVALCKEYASWKTGDSEQAERMMLQGVHIITTQNAPGAPHSRDALFEYRDFLKAMHRSLDVKRINDQLAQATPQPCAN